MKSNFAFITFKHPADAAFAVKEFDRTDFEGRQLTVERSRKYNDLLSRLIFIQIVLFRSFELSKKKTTHNRSTSR